MQGSFLIANLAMAIFFGWYAFYNPDVIQTGYFYPDYWSVSTETRVNCWAAETQVNWTNATENYTGDILLVK